jgi:hypothetical protein
MANNLLALVTLTRDAVRLFRNSLGGLQQYSNEFAQDGARVGAQLRVRLPSDFRVVEAPAPLDNFERYEDELVCRWLATYDITTDQIRCRYDAKVGELSWPERGGVQSVSEAERQWAREALGAQLEEVRRRARAAPGEQFSCDFVSTLWAARPAFCQTDETHKRSLELLRAWLTPVQLASFERTGSFEVTGGSSGHRYLLRSQYSFGVEPLEGQLRGSLLCVVPRNAPALGDILLAQKIGLETSERATLAKANKKRYLQPEGA